MKKLSFFLMAMLISVMGFADTYTHTFKSGELKVGTVTLSGVSWTGAGTVEYWGWDSNSAKGIQIGSSSKPCKAYSLTTSGIEGTITEVVVNTSTASSGTAKLSISVGGTSYLSNKSLTTTATNYTATGDASGDLVISYTNTAKAFYIKSISVTYVVEENPDAVKYTVTANVNDPAMGKVTGAGEYEEGKTATLTAVPNPAYKFVSWSNGSTDNPLKFTVTEDVELTATFEALPAMTCAEASAAASGATVVLNPFDVVAVVKGAGYIYIKDESGVALIFDYTMDDQLKAGDHVEGFVGVSSPYNGLPELKPSVAFADLKVTPGTAPEPTLFTAAPTKADVNKYVKFENVTLTANATFTTSGATNATMVVNGTNVTLRNSFKLAATLSKDKAYNIVGFAAIYNSTIQVYFLSAEEYVAPEPCTLATPVNWDAPITAEANTDQWYAVNVASAIAAGKDLALTVSNPGEEAVEITMEAYADCPATELIVKLTKTFNAGETKTTTVKYDEYLADQVEVVYMHVTTKGGEIKVEAEPEIEWMPMDLEIANLTTEVMEVEGAKYLLLQGRDDTNDADVMLFLNNYADVDDDYEVNAESSYMTFGGMELTVIDGVMTQTSETDKGTIYTGTVRASVEMEGATMYVEFALTMYAALPVEVAIENATARVDEETGALVLNAEWTKDEITYPVFVRVADYEDVEFKEYEGAQISELQIGGDGEDDPWLDFAVANAVTVTKKGNTVSIEGEYTSWATGTTYTLLIDGNLPEPEPTTETVYFINNKGWSKVNAYAWEPVQNANWPGVAATKEAEQIGGYDVYSFTADAGKYANVIFNNGSGSQTADLKWTAGKYVINNKWYTKEEAEAELVKPVEYEYVYFVDNQGWGKVNIYTWTPEVGTWPGVAMTKEAEQLAGYDVYSYKAEKGTSFGGIIFNNGSGVQTGDLQWTAGKYYVQDAWYTKEEAEAKLAGPVTPPVITYVLMGVAGDWTTGIALTVNPDNENEYVLLGQEILDGDAVKVVTLTDGVATAWCGNVDEWSVEYTTDDMGNIILAPGIYDFYYKVAEDIIYIGGEAYTEEPTYEVYEDEITNLVFDLESMMCYGGPSANFQVDVFLALGEENGDGTYALTEESSISVMGSDATFIEGYLANIDVYAPKADAVIRCDWNGMKLEFHLTMSAAPVEATVVVVENANVEVQKYHLFGDMYDYALTMTGTWYNEADGLEYPVLVEVPVYYPEATEPSTILSTVTVGGWGDADPWLGFGEGELTITTVDGVVTATGVVNNPMAGIAIDITISGVLPTDGPGTGTGLDNLDTTVAPAKLIENGQLIIIKNGVRYNATGAIVK